MIDVAEFAPPALSPQLRPEWVPVAAGTQFWQVQRDQRETPFTLIPHVEPFGGGRFDSNQAHRYPFSYLASEPDTALCETLLRSVPFADRTNRILPYEVVRDRTLRAVRTVVDLRLIGLRTTRELAGVCADEWLIHAEPRDYPYTRGWAHWLRAQLPAADGLVWPSRRNLGGTALILFGDRCPAAVDWDADEPALDLDGEDGRKVLNQRLEPFRAMVHAGEHSALGTVR